MAYDWGKEVPEGIDLPVDNKEYATQADAEAAVNQSYSNGTTVKGEKNGKEGVWTFSGWTISVDGLVVKQQVAGVLPSISMIGTKPPTSGQKICLPVRQKGYAKKIPLMWKRKPQR
ncbi:MAG: SHIRT domain-containing protein [Bacteroides xylanisolvens]